MARVHYFVAYMQTAPKCNTFYIHHHGGVQRPRGAVYTNLWYTPAIFLFSLSQNPVVVYMWCPHYVNVRTAHERRPSGSAQPNRTSSS